MPVLIATAAPETVLATLGPLPGVEVMALPADRAGARQQAPAPPAPRHRLAQRRRRGGRSGRDATDGSRPVEALTDPPGRRQQRDAVGAARHRHGKRFTVESADRVHGERGADGDPLEFGPSER